MAGYSDDLIASGTILASIALLLLGCAPASSAGMVNAGYIASTYVLITLAELWVSAIGLSMIGLYCDKKMLGFAMGAQVIKIENKLTNGDVTRSWRLAAENKETTISAYYASVNWNKRSVFLDLNKSEDKQQVYNYIKDADIVISNYKPGDDQKLGMDYETLKKINSTLIYAHLTGFGKFNKRTAYDLVLQAETGFMYINGTKESGPLKMPVALIDVLAAHQMKEAILIALIKRIKTGKGSSIHVSLFDSAIASLANQASNWLMTKFDPQPIGSLHPNIAPYGETFITKDKKQIVLAVGNDKQFEKLCVSLNCEELFKNVKFASNSNRVKNRNELFLLLQPIFENRISAELMNNFILKDIPAGIVKSVKEVFDTPEINSLILTENNGVDNESKRVKTLAFSIYD